MGATGLPGFGSLDRVLLATVLAGVALAVGVGAVLAPTMALAGVLGLVFVFLSFRDLGAGLAFFVALTFFDSIPGVPATSLTGVKVAGGVLVLAWLFVIANREKVPLVFRDSPFLAQLVVLFVFVAFISSLWATDRATSINHALRLSQGVVLFAVVFSALRQPKHLRWLIWAFVSGAVLTALIGIGGASSAETITSYGGTTRLSGNIDDPNFLAAILVPALVLAGFLIAAEWNPFARWILAISVAILVVALFLTQSRGGLVGLAAAAVAGVFLAGRLRARVLISILATGAVTIVYYTMIAPPVVLARISAFSSGGGTGRLDLWHIALVMYRKHPLGGVGIGNFQILEPRYANAGFNISRIDLVLDNPRVVHNTYLHVLVELGAIGFAAFVLLVLTTIFYGIRYTNLLSRIGDWRSELYSRGLVVAMIGTLAADFFLSAQYDKRFWLLLGAVAAIRSMTFSAESGNTPDARVRKKAGSISYGPERHEPMQSRPGP